MERGFRGLACRESGRQMHVLDKTAHSKYALAKPVRPVVATSPLLPAHTSKLKRIAKKRLPVRIRFCTDVILSTYAHHIQDSIEQRTPNSQKKASKQR